VIKEHPERDQVQLEEVKTTLQDKDGWRKVVCGLCFTGSDKA